MTLLADFDLQQFLLRQSPYETSKSSKPENKQKQTNNSAPLHNLH